MGINEVFMGYDKWFNYQGFNKKQYNSPIVHMLYRDRLILWGMPIIVMGTAIYFFWYLIIH